MQICTSNELNKLVIQHKFWPISSCVYRKTIVKRQKKEAVAVIMRNMNTCETIASSTCKNEKVKIVYTYSYAVIIPDSIVSRRKTCFSIETHRMKLLFFTFKLSVKFLIVFSHFLLIRRGNQKKNTGAVCATGVM